MVFQSYALFPTMSVYDNIAFGLRVQKLSKDEDVYKRQCSDSGTEHSGLYLPVFPAGEQVGQCGACLLYTSCTHFFVYIIENTCFELFQFCLGILRCKGIGIVCLHYCPCLLYTSSKTSYDLMFLKM